MQDAKEILEFNKFMRKRLMEFYRLTKCPVPHSSMLFKRRKSFKISRAVLQHSQGLFHGPWLYQGPVNVSVNQYVADVRNGTF